ncbi:spore germination protein [Sutcliffiella halmapala]|uniref:spore germination protein n=1 Tax=Sutcliffiella halmapala TaxID=79882 RepID=UPI000995CD1C|nr:spore germination protein [Sutcliffiella halmapala]
MTKNRSRKIVLIQANATSYKKVKKSKLETIYSTVKESVDIEYNSFFTNPLKRVKVEWLYCKTLVDLKYIDEFIMPKVKSDDFSPTEFLANVPLYKEKLQFFNEETVLSEVLNGKLVMVVNNETYTLLIRKLPNRAPEEPVTEPTIRGPRDGFVEDVYTNIALIRRRYKTKSLVVDTYVLGKRSNTDVAILYDKDIINPEIMKELKRRIKKVDVDILHTNQYLEEALSDHPFSLLPLFNYTARADFAVESINSGRFVIIVDGLPTVSIAPISVAHLFKSAEDANINPYFATFERLIRLVALFIATLLPGFWLSLTAFNLDQIPYPFLATISVSRYGIPMSTPLEMFIMLILFELFNEAGVRLPKAIGQTVAVFGGLIVGDAAIRAGLTSPTMLVVVAITFISGFTLVNQSFSTAITIIRLSVVALSAIFGIFGVVLSFFLISIFLASLQSFGVPYLATLAPIKKREVLKSFFRLPSLFYNSRPGYLQTKDSTRQEE